MARLMSVIGVVCVVIFGGCSGGDDDSANNQNENTNGNSNTNNNAHLCDVGTISGAARLEGRTDHSGVTVTLTGTSKSVQTEADGAFQFDEVAPGIYTVQAQAAGFTGATSGAVLVQTPPCDATVLPLQLAVPRGGLEGVVTREDTTEHGGILVNLQGTPYAALTGPSGAYSFSGVPVGQYTVVASEPPYQPASASDQVVEVGAVTAVPALVLRYPPSDCGNGVLEAAEQCDGTNLGGATCTDFGFTGGILGCQSCHYDVSRCATCGNGIVETTESCDDGNRVDDLTCSADCQHFCGDGVFSPALGETCDHGTDNGISPSDCLSDCTFTTCGDGHVGGGEPCDDGNSDAGDGCAPGCVVEPGWECTGSPSECRCAGFGRGPGCEECVVFVSASANPGTATGRDFAHAFPSVQEGIDAAHSEARPCEVWIAAGTYYVYRTSPRDTIALRSQISVYGGFAGTESERNERDPATNVAVLSGYESASSVNRVFHVVTADFTTGAVLDGLTITGGNAIGGTNDGDDRGAGLKTNLAELTVADCRFSGNEGSGYPAMYLFGNAMVTVDQVRVQDNPSTLGRAAIGIYGGVAVMGDLVMRDNNWGIDLFGSDLILERGQFSDQMGGIMAHNGGAIEVRDSTFIRCGSAIDLSGSSSILLEQLLVVSGGGGIGFFTEGSAVVRDCIIAGNIGHGLNITGGNVEVEGCQVSGNGDFGVHLYHMLGGGVQIRNTIVAGNRQHGGIYWTTDPTVPASLMLESCVVSGNHSSLAGGGIHFNPTSMATPVFFALTHTTIAGNHAEGCGGALHYNAQVDSAVIPTSEIVIANNILWGNTAPSDSEISQDSTILAPTLDYNHLGQLPDWLPLLHNTVADPAFAAGPGSPEDEGTWAAVDHDPSIEITWLSVAGQPWQPDALVGHFVQPDIRDPRWLPIVANTASAVAVWGDVATILFDLGDFGVGSTYRLFDLRLDAASTCIDAGIGCDQQGGCAMPWSLPQTPAEDIRGNARHNAGQSSANGGAGMPDYADRGAYEWQP